MITAALLGVAGPAVAGEPSRCITRILANVHAEEAPKETKSKSNGSFGPITQVKVSAKPGG